MYFSLESVDKKSKNKKLKAKLDFEEAEEKEGYVTWKNKTKVPIEFIDKM